MSLSLLLLPSPPLHLAGPTFKLEPTVWFEDLHALIPKSGGRMSFGNMCVSEGLSLCFWQCVGVCLSLGNWGGTSLMSSHPNWKVGPTFLRWALGLRPQPAGEESQVY